MIPASIASYRIVRQIGEGGMGVVYEAIHDSLGRRAAIKVLHPEFSQNTQIRARFFNEARAVNMVQHPGIVSIYQFGEYPDGSMFLIMEFLDGDSLRKRVKQYGRPMPVSSVTRLGRQMASALAAAHKMKIVHRDLKPDNVMLVADPDVAGGERAKLLDFGIAKVADDPKNPGGGVKTRTGMMMGTPAYMAPEQCRGAGEVDEYADVYSLGIMLYEMLTGRPPFIDSASGELIARHLFEQPPPILSLTPSVPAELADLVHKMLAKRADERPSMLSIVQQLDAQGSPSDALVGSMPVPLPHTLIEHPSLGPGTLTQVPRQSGTRLISNVQTRFIATSAFGCVLLVSFLSWRLGSRQLERQRSAVPSSSETRPVSAERLPIQAHAPQMHLASDVENTCAPRWRKVKWLIHSTPSGATIIKENDQKHLGQTPWTTEALSATGEEQLLLRLSGYEDVAIDVPRDRDTDFHVEMIRTEESQASSVARTTGMDSQTSIMKESIHAGAPIRPAFLSATPNPLDALPNAAIPSVSNGDGAVSTTASLPAKGQSAPAKEGQAETLSQVEAMSETERRPESGSRKRKKTPAKGRGKTVSRAEGKGSSVGTIEKGRSKIDYDPAAP